MNAVCRRICRGLKRLLCTVVLAVIGVWLAAMVAFRFIPVPFSAVMAERQLSAWWQGDWHYRAHSQWVAMGQISPYMALAVMAGEDQKFPYHWGFDFAAISQALKHNQQADSRLRGASTLSQQTAKNLFLWEGRSWLRKGLEAGLTVGIEALWSKQRILTVYLNIADFGDGTFGVEAAARHYFRKSACQLNASEAALLAAALPNPHRYQVDAPGRWLYVRQQWILRQMRQMGGEQFLTENDLYPLTGSRCTG